MTASQKQAAKEEMKSTITQAWTSGRTLEASTVKRLSALMPVFAEQPVKDDRGYNCLIDLAHECTFASLWELPEQLFQLGYRAIGSQATVNTVLDPHGYSRVRIIYDPKEKIYPFAWWPNAKFDVMITSQSSPKEQPYTDTEIASMVQFVKQGGGLLIQADPLSKKDIKAGVSATGWSLNKLTSAFGGRFTGQDTLISGIRWAVMQLSKEWSSPNASCSDTQMKGLPDQVLAMRSFGKGRVILCGSQSAIKDKPSGQSRSTAGHFLGSLMTLLTEFQKPTGGTLMLPQAMEGGGAIYPELEEHFSNIVFYYAANQKPDLINTVKNDVPKAQSFVQQRLPSTPTAEPMYLVLCAGDGGGWAVNIYRPKENGIISLDANGILSIFGHELAHTMFGPANEAGQVAGIAPIPDRGEAHAGWFQGKVNALFQPDLRTKANRECNSLFAFDRTGCSMDLAKCYENEDMDKKWGYGKDWIKTWYIWQKMDDRYGPSWYPNWKWVQHTRWKDDPGHHLTWDEMVEDMSIAVGEDLFPFFIKVGTTLNKKRLSSIVFQGKTITLSVAPITVTPAGKVRMEPIDFTKPVGSAR